MVVVQLMLLKSNAVRYRANDVRGSCEVGLKPKAGRSPYSFVAQSRHLRRLSLHTSSIEDINRFHHVEFEIEENPQLNARGLDRRDACVSCVVFARVTHSSF